MTHGDIERLEGALKVTLPQRYTELLLRYPLALEGNGFHFGDGFEPLSKRFFVNDIDRLIELHETAGNRAYLFAQPDDSPSGTPRRVMRVMLLGGTIETRAAVERLIEGSSHHFEWRKTVSRGGLEVKNCDLLLVDGASLLRDEAQQLRTCLMREARSGGSAVFFFNSCIEAGDKLSGAARLPRRLDSGGHRTAAGHWSMRCRLQEQALEEYRAGALDAGSRPADGAVVFEHQGEAVE